MSTSFRGEAVYTADVDAHFPELCVGDTLYFAARARSPRNIPKVSVGSDMPSTYAMSVFLLANLIVVPD